MNRISRIIHDYGARVFVTRLMDIPEEMADEIRRRLVREME